MFGRYSAVLLFAILVLGCTDMASYGGLKNDGIVIRDFSFNTPEIVAQPDAKALASFVVENVGSKVVPGDIHVWFYKPMGWDIEPEGTIDLTSGETVINGETFYPAIPEQGIPPSSKRYDVVLTPPQLGQGITQKYVFYAEVCYPYSTTMLGRITSTSQNEFSVSQRQDMTPAETKETYGPVGLRLESRKNIHFAGKIPIVISVENRARGFPTSNEEECEEDVDFSLRDKVHIYVLVDGSSQGVDCGGEGNVATVELVNGKGVLFCTYDATSSAYPKTTYHISATAEYKYYSRQSAEVSVEGLFQE